MLSSSLKGQGRSDHVGCVRTRQPVPQSCHFYHYEVKILNQGRGGYIGVGFSTWSSLLNAQPGWQLDTLGYHGDDGRKYEASGWGEEYGPTFTTGDVIGCTLSLQDRTCFFSKNGTNLGIAFTGQLEKKTT